MTREQLALELLETRQRLAHVTAAFQRLHEPPMGTGKPAMRSAALARRDRVDDATHAALAARLAEVGAAHATAYLHGRHDGMVSLYSAIGSEPRVDRLADALADAGVALALPVDWSHGGPLVYRHWAPGDRLAAGPLGIAEPLPEAPACDPDVLVVPLVAFDRRGYRIGYGAGNVDVTLRLLRARKTVLVIGVAFSVQEELLIPDERHDQRVDVIITERDTITVGG